MKLSAALGLFIPLRDAFKYAFMPFLKDKSNITAWRLNSFVKLRRTFFFHLWKVFGKGSDQGSQQHKQELIDPIKGVVLDVGAGLGHTIKYLKRDQVSRYIAVEPNMQMHSELRDAAHEAGYFESDGSFVLLGCGVEKILGSSLAPAGTTVSSVDAIICILSLCSIPHAEENITRLVREYLRPGGSLLMFEHVRHPLADVAWWQSLWSPLWGVFFDGCRLDCPTDKWVERMKDVDELGKEVAMWKEQDLKAIIEDGWEEQIMYHVLGTFIKHD